MTDQPETGIFDKISLVLSTWFGVGYIPFASGTFGTIAAVPLVLFLGYVPVIFKIFFIACFVYVAIAVSDNAICHFNAGDPSQVVIDEVAGFLVTMVLFQLTWKSLLFGFLCFRFFDILKPYPIRKLEKLKGGTGIVMDDLMAGIYACISLEIILSFYV